MIGLAAKRWKNKRIPGVRPSSDPTSWLFGSLASTCPGLSMLRMLPTLRPGFSSDLARGRTSEKLLLT